MGPAQKLEIAEGIHLIPRVRGANAYLVEGDEGITVVDTGLPGSTGKILDYVQSIGYHHSDVKTIVLTHSDMDHAGSAAQLKEETHAKVAIHEADAPRLSGEKQWKAVKGVLGLFLRVAGAVMRFTRLKADVLLKDSDVIDGLTVIHTPGHTEGSICLYLPGRALFVGDVLLTNGERILTLPRKSMSMDMNLAKESVRKVSQLEYSVLLPGHGPPIKQNASTVTKEFATRF
jgi:glyoxylase-like metal-dependent hydrolase (beta-lactamase superfamily II)